MTHLPVAGQGVDTHESHLGLFMCIVTQKEVYHFLDDHVFIFNSLLDQITHKKGDLQSMMRCVVIIKKMVNRGNNIQEKN